MKTKFLIILIGVCASTSLFAQQSNVTIAYSIGFTSGELNDFISQASFRGISFDYRYHIQPKLALGVNVAWQTFYEEKPSDTYTDGSASLTGKQYRYSNHVPMLATVAYFLKPDEPINPFFSLGLGTSYVRRNTDMNFYTVEDDVWPFLLQPEVGAQFKFNDLAAIAVTLKYNYGFQAGELPDPQSYIALNVGFAFY